MPFALRGMRHGHTIFGAILRHMKSLETVPVKQYLRSTYDPDCDYVDGEVVERPMGERDHSELQREFILFFGNRYKKWKVFVFPEQRIQVSRTRFRVPDVCVYVGEKPREQVLRTPPFICIEILSPEDRTSRLQQKIDDYIAFGVPHVWVVDPKTRRAWVHTREGSRQAKDALRTETPAFEVPLAELFAALD